jgi:hypothetical protein
MSKTVLYKEEPFVGSVTFSDPLSLEQEAAYERAHADTQRAISQLGGANNGSSAILVAALPGILACVEKIELNNIPKNVTVQTWPTRPRLAVAALVAWMLTEVSNLYEESTDTKVPNAPSPQPTPTPAARENSPENSTSSTPSTVSVSAPS